MGVYIQSVGMPEDGETVTITICADGLVFEEFKEPADVFHALPIKPHGRLIDADKMRESIRRQAGFLKLMGGELADFAETLENGFLQEIDNAPTVIEAEEGET